MATINSRRDDQARRPRFDQGNCTQNKTHIANLTVDIRRRGLPAHCFGSPPPIGECRDSHRKLWAVAHRLHRPRQRAQWAAWHHQPDDRQRANQISDDVYGPKTLTQY